MNNVFEKLIIKDVKTKQPSYTVTAFIVGFFIVNLKLLLSGITINNITMSDFNGVDYAAAIAALGGIYVMRKNKTIKTNIKEINNLEEEEK